MVNFIGTTEDTRVVVSGISGRFPKSNNVAELRENLLNGKDCTTTDHGRWDDFENEELPYRLGTFNNTSKFDRVFFGVNHKLACLMDPITRIMLEHCFEAVMDAGVNPRTLKGSNTAVITATNLSESEKSLFQNIPQLNGLGIMGYSKTMVPNRVSFFLNLKGPSINMDSGDTGAGSALEKAYIAIKNGECDAAIVGGANQCLHPQVSYQLKKLGLLCSDGFTRCFDDNASGHTRSEAITALYLQRAEDAKRIYVEVVNTRTLHVDSFQLKSSLYPKMEPQIELMKTLLEESRLTPDDISFFEASGMSIPDLDGIELNAIDAVYGRRENPLPIGSIKSNIGNTTAANLNAAIIKMIIAGETEKIAPNLHYKKANSKAPCLNEGRVKVLTELAPWYGQYAAVNVTSYNATISHTILKVPNIEKKNNGVPDDDLPRLVIASGRTENAVEIIFNHMKTKALDVEFLQLLYDIFQTEIEGHLYRGYVLIPAKDTLAINLSCKKDIMFNSGEKPQVWWIFSGMGSQWVGMGEALLKLPVFEAAIRKCDAILKPLGFDIFKVITEKNPKIFGQIINSFIGIAAIQIGLVDVLKAVDLEPDCIIGHSVGELGCAYADGCFTAEQMILTALSRGLASMETTLEFGSMAAVGLGYAGIKDLCPPDVDVACHNGPDSSTISGPAESMRAFVDTLKAKGIFAKEVPCSNIAFHSRYIAPAGEKLLEKLQKIIPTPKSRSAKWLSTSVPKAEQNTVKARLSSAEYHTNNLLNPVLFEETLRHIPSNAVCVEIAPHGLLQAILKRSLPKTCVNIPLMRRGDSDNLQVLLTALGTLYNVGLQPQIANLYPKVEYPVGKGTPSISSLIRWDHSVDWPVYYYCPAKEFQNGIKTFEIDLNQEGKHLQGYIIDGKVVIPLGLFLLKAWEIFENFAKNDGQTIVYKEIKIYKPLVDISDDNILRFTVAVFKGTREFEITVSEIMVMTGVMEVTKASNENQLKEFQMKNKEDTDFEVNRDDFYAEMEMRGYQYPQNFKGVIKSSMDGTKALIKWDNDWMTFIDSALQLFLFGNDLRVVEVPLLIRTIIVNQRLQEVASKNSDGLKAFINKKFNYLSAGGLEILGPKFTVMPRTIKQNKISNDVFRVIPNVDRSDVPIDVSLRVILQLILENTFSSKIQTIELLDNDDVKEINKLKNSMLDIPEATFFKTKIVSYENANFNKALIVMTDLKNYDLEKISEKLEMNKFLLAFVNSNQEEFYKKLAESAGLMVILIREHANKTLLLLRKKQSLTIIQVINLSEKNIDETIDKMKNIVVSSENERVLLIMKSDNINYVIQCVHKIQEVANLANIRIFNIPNSMLSNSNTVLQKVCVEQSKLDLIMNVLTSNNVWATLRRTRVSLKPKPTKSWIANQRYSNNPFSITWIEAPIFEKADNLAEVYYSAINSQDVLIAKKLFDTGTSGITGKNRLIEKKSIGLEFSGVDLNGNKIMGITNGNAMSSHVCADSEWTWQVPKSWSFEDAATVPFSYIIAYTALFINGEAKAGDKVLLTNTCDSVGLAVLNLAIREKCDVYIIYETDAEKVFIQSIAPSLPNNRFYKSVANSFRDELAVEFNGEGIDVLIYNHYDVKKLKLFYEIIKWVARVVSINDLNGDHVLENMGMEIFLKEIYFRSISPQTILSYDSKTKKILADMLKDGINKGFVKPLPRVVYPRDSLTEAFHAYVTRRHLEKILVKVQANKPNESEALGIPRFYCSDSKSYVLIEGLSRFGTELAEWLITRGAKHFVITSSGKCNSDYKNFRMKLWQSYGVKIMVYKEFDLSSKNLEALFKKASNFRPIDAIFDLQRMFMTPDKVEAYANTFNSTTRTVDEISRLVCPNLRLFVVCSTIRNPENLTLFKICELFDSISCQSATIEKVLEQRKEDNLPGLFVRWGLEDFTMEHIDNIYAKNLPPITEYLKKLDEILGIEESVVELSYIVPLTNEISDEVVVQLTPEQKDAQEFTSNFYEKTNLDISDFAYFQIKENSLS